KAREELLKFTTWLDTHAAADLKDALDELFGYGRPFTLFLKTAAGGHLEADGRATGARAVLRLRDVAGTKQDLVRILDQHRRLTREIRVSRALMNTLPIAVWMKDDDGHLKWVNQAYVSAVDAATSDEVYDRQLELLESRQRSTLETSLKGARAFSKRLPLLIGGERKAHDVFAVETDEVIAAAAIDVADLETAKGELDRQLMALDRTLDRVATPVAMFGRDGRLTFHNEAYQELWRLDPAWLAQSPSDGEILDRLKELSQLPAMADYRKWKVQVLSCYQSSLELEDWWQLPDGRMLHVVAAQRPDGGVTYIYDDVSERLQLERQYNALIQVQRETLDSLKEGVAVFATNGRLQLFNTAFLSIWRVNRVRMEQGPHIDEVIDGLKVLFENDDVWQSMKEVVTSITYQREAYTGHMERADGSYIDFAATPLPDGGTLITFADVTASKSYERALIERNEALEAADRLKSQFIGHVSYELRTPLTNIIGFNELLLSPYGGALTDKQREYLGDISSSSRQLLSIIDDILDLANIDAGGLELAHEPVRIKPMLDDLAGVAAERASGEGILLDVAVADDVDSFIADESRIRQVLDKILSNAIGFSHPGGEVRISCWRETGLIAFSIADNGVGIPEEEQERVFERFVSHSQGSHHRGAGLGLSIVKSLVELHHGSMTLVSEPDKGTTVTVRFPIDGRHLGATHDADAEA
ncbi:MAG: PAS-domain containing protein, partial [Hyphomicrobiaceae bacterium]|nr:PAS-domain containing protein [Hyphomicrobiaceae bacterium]